MEYFYTSPGNVSSASLIIADDEFNHLAHVMRKNVGDHIVVVDGKGTAYEATLTSIDRHTASCAIDSTLHRLHEPRIDLTLAVAMLKHPALYDFLVEKCTELGVTTIIPMTTRRTIARQARTDRWQKIALAAMKQCGRCVLPRIEEPLTFDEILQRDTSGTLRLIPHEQVTTPYPGELIAPETGSVLICIGPEGGFTEEEISKASRAGVHPVSLGPRRLRTETAAIAATGLTIRGE